MVMFRFYLIILFLFSLLAGATDKVDSARGKAGSASADKVQSARISEIDLYRLIKRLEDRPSSTTVFGEHNISVLREIRDRKINIREYPVLLYKVMEIVAFGTNYHVYKMAQRLLDRDALVLNKKLLKNLDSGDQELLLKALNELLNSPSELDPAVQARLAFFVWSMRLEIYSHRFEVYREIRLDHKISERERVRKLVDKKLDEDKVEQLAIRILQKKEPAELLYMLVGMMPPTPAGRFPYSWMRAGDVLRKLKPSKEFVRLQLMQKWFSLSITDAEKSSIYRTLFSITEKHGKLLFNDSVQSVILPALVADEMTVLRAVENDVEVLRAIENDVEVLVNDSVQSVILPVIEEDVVTVRRTAKNALDNFTSFVPYIGSPLSGAYNNAETLDDSKIFVLQHLIAQEEERFKFHEKRKAKERHSDTPLSDYSPTPEVQTLVWRILALALSDRDSNVREQAVALFNVKSTAVSLLVSSFERELSQFAFDLKDVSSSSRSVALEILQFDRSPPRSFSQRCYRAFKSAVGVN